MIEKLKKLRDTVYMSEEQPGLDLLDEIIQEVERDEKKYIRWGNIRSNPGAVIIVFIIVFLVIYGMMGLIFW